MSIENERKAFVRASLRRATFRWKYRYQALQNAKVERGRYLCALCFKVVRAKEIRADHIIPVIGEHGWESYDSFINRLLCDLSGWQAICNTCHQVKTRQENDIRRKNKKLKKKK